ncbi:MAG: DNA polymerase III subunit gamma/tau [Phycisphaerae bacterium]
MAYTVLARKYRSRTFDEVVGQEPIATTLVNSITAARIHHGYLFTGTRGVGKTSMARILAKALNCLKADGPTTKPCLECDSCKGIAEGQDIDVVEIDAASNTGVDNIRELRANTAFRPARARFKIYIIDEVHMLSTGAFNALLKTLEEPPDHVKFILATTEIQKVPATIRSRCQCFNFRNIGADEIAGVVTKIAADEGTAMDDAVAKRIARLANGSMRDALSLLDQLISVSPKRVSADVLDEILPPAQDEQVFALLQCAAAGDAAAALAKVDEILASGRGLESLCTDAIEVARSLMLIRACGIDAPMVDVPAGGRDSYKTLSAAFELSQFVQMIAMLEELRRNVRFSGSGRALTDAVVVRLSHMKQWTALETLLARAAGNADPIEKKKTLTSVVPMPASIAPAARTAEPAFVVTDPRVVEQPPSAAAAIESRSYAITPEPRAQTGRPNLASEPRAQASGVTRSTSTPAPSESPHSLALGVRTDDLAPAPDRVDFDTTALEPSDDGDDDTPDSPAATSPRTADLRPMALPVSAEMRAKIMHDPVVTQALDLFDGMIVNMQRIVHAAPAVPTDDSE